MSVPPIPVPVEMLSERPFSFYPPILNVEHNEWNLLQASWAEIQVENTREPVTVWVPRRFLGDISSVDLPVMIVGLVKELEYRAGVLIPIDRRVVEMPPPPAERRPPMVAEARPTAEPTHRPRFEGSERRIGKLIAWVLAVSIAICIFVIAVFQGHQGGRVTFRSVVQSDLGLTARDDYFSVIQKLGPPAEEHWRENSGELQYRELSYPAQKIHVILMGPERDTVRYIGAVDDNWKTVHSVELPGGRNSASILKSLPRF